MMLGLGLGLNKNNFISSVDPIIDALIKANCTMYLDPNKADGTSKGINSPLTNPLTDLIGSNDATLVNFNGTVSSGYDDLTLPNTNVKTFLKGDGVDDYGIIADNESLNPTGTEDFAFCGVFKTDTTIKTSYIFVKNTSTSADVQYGIFIESTGTFKARLSGNILYEILGAGSILPNTLYSFTLKRINGRLKIAINGVEEYNQPNGVSLVSRDFIRVFCRSNSLDGTVNSLFGNHEIAPLVFFYNGATGLNETDVDDACALLKADYF